MPLCSHAEMELAPSESLAALTAYEVIRASVVLIAGTQGQALGSVLHTGELIDSSRPSCPLGVTGSPSGPGGD